MLCQDYSSNVQVVQICLSSHSGCLASMALFGYWIRIAERIKSVEPSLQSLCGIFSSRLGIDLRSLASMSKNKMSLVWRTSYAKRISFVLFHHPDSPYGWLKDLSDKR